MPSISTVTGTVLTGQILTVNGSALIAENRTNYDAWMTATRGGFEGASVSADGWDTNQSSPVLQYDTTTKVRGSKSMRSYLQGASLWIQGGASGIGGKWGWLVDTANDAWSVGQPKDVYIRAYLRWNYYDSVTGAVNWPRLNTASDTDKPFKKLWWADNPGITGYSLTFNCNDDGSAASSWFVDLTTAITGVDEAGQNQLGSFPDGPIKNNKWYCFEFHYVKANSGGPYVVEGWVDGVLTGSLPALAGFDPSNTGAIEQRVNEWNTNSTWQGYEWTDELAVSTSRIRPLCICEIGDSATYASAHPKYQYPEYFSSDSSVQFNCDLTGLTGPNYWMWITDSTGTRSSAFPLTGGVDTTSPILSNASIGTPSSVGTVGARVNTDEAGGILYWTTYSDGSVPSDAEVKNHNGTGAQASSAYGESLVLNTGTQVIAPIVGLAASTPYDVYFVHEDASANLSTKIKADLTTLVGDVTSPILSNITIGTVSSTGTSGHSVDTDEANGILYWVVLTSGGSATADQIKLGTGGDIVPGYHWLQTVNSTGTQVSSPNTIAGLFSSTQYRLSFLHTDAAGNNSSQLGVDFTTDAAEAVTLFFQEDFNDSNFASRGWFDLAGSNIDTVVFSPNGGNSSYKIHWGAGSTQVATPKRHAIPATESIYVKFDVKFGTAGVVWQGSGLPYHPHIFQVLTDADDEWIGPSQTNLSCRIETRLFTPCFNFGDALRIFTTNPYPSVAGTYPHNSSSPSLLGTSANHAVWGGNGIQTSSGANYYDVGDSWDNTAEYNAGAPAFTNNTWHTVEALFIMNSVVAGVPQADGVAKYWVDGSLKINHTNAYFRTGAFATQKFKTFLFVPYIGDGSPIAQDMWVDNLEVWSNVPSDLDTTDPVISNKQGTGNFTTGTITWDTDEAATSVVEYGLTASYGSTVSDSSLVTSHSVTLPNLSSSVTYHYRVTSADASLNSTTSADGTFTTRTYGMRRGLR